jgi:CTP synthase (UTP-ammonia lyase)
VLQFPDADSAEHNPQSKHIIISPVLCAVPQRGPTDPKLCGPVPGIRLQPGSLLQRIYGREEIVEEFFCNYEVNPQYEPQLASAGLKVVARGEHGEPRAVELAGHTFFVATLFQPQLSSGPQKPHPLLTAFLRAAAEFSRRSQAPVQSATA